VEHNDLLVVGDLSHGRRLAIAAGTTFDATADGVISRLRDGELLGGILYTQFTGVSCTVHLAGLRARWGNRALVWIGMDYPFRQLGLERIIGFVPQHNTAARRLNEHLGFKEVARIPGVYPGGRARLVLSLEREDCRILDWPRPTFTVAQGDR
jgi:RimJ/RimL family protein N-acetyltransferase